MTRRFIRHLLLALPVSACALLAPATATSTGGSAPALPHMDALLSSWRADHGQSWRVEVDGQTGYLEMLYGGNVPSDVRPTQDGQFEELALDALQRTATMHGIDLDTLEFESARFLPLGQFGTTDKETVRYRQQVNGVRVVNGLVNVLFSAEGALLSVHSTGLPNLSGFDTTPTIEALEAAAIAAAGFIDQTGLTPTGFGRPELVIDQIVTQGRRSPRLVWLVNMLWEVSDSEPVGWRYSVDARDGAIVRSEPSVHFDVSGTVSAMSTPGLRPDVASNPPVAQIMKYLRCTSASGTTYTDASGNFNYPGVNAPLSVTFQFTSGQRANIMNTAGAEYSLTLVLQPNQANSILMNPAPTGQVTAQANGMFASNTMSDFIHAITPGDTHADFSALANVNLSQTCNAYFNGTSTNYYLPGGGCPNTAYSTVVSHEIGHWMNVLYTTGNGSDGMGEGNADVWAMYIWDTPVIAQDFYGAGTNIRTGTNNRQFCGDCCGGCYGEVHVDGEVWMGAAWKVRAALKATHGTVVGGQIANSLFLGWMNAYNQGQIRSIIETQWMTLDDDNGDITDGTPNFEDIDIPFRQQGFPGLVVQCPAPTNYCVTTPNTYSPLGAVMGYAGTNEISNNDFVLFCFGMPPNKLGIVFYGQTQTFVPFGNGMRCVANPFFRLPPTYSNMFGDLTLDLDLNVLPSGGQISAGQIWNFQTYFRDPAGGGPSFDASDGLNVPWCN